MTTADTANSGMGPVPLEGTRSRGRLARLLTRILGERSTPARMGWAVAVGILIGTSPFFGFHFAICLAVATILGLNRAITYLAANISGPWLAPLLVFGSVQTGHLILTGRWLSVTMEAFQAVDPWSFATAWFLGGLVLGCAIGAPAGLVTWAGLRLYRRRHPLPPDPVERTMESVVDRYRGLRTRTWKYVEGKFRHDPVYRQIASLCPLPMPILDVGCGRGQTLLLVAAMQSHARGIGVDWSAEKIEIARRAAAATDRFEFEVADAASWHPPSGAGTVLLVDLLHYLPAPSQDEILRRAARALSSGGALYIRDVDAGAGPRAWVSRAQEWVGRLIGLNHGATLCFRPMAEIVEVIASEGLVTREVPVLTGLPFGNVLIEARRPPDPATAP